MRSAVARRRALPVLVLAVAVALTAGACNLIRPLDPSLEAKFLTSEADDDYGITVDGGTTVVAAPATNVGGNSRVAFWPADAPAVTDQLSCVAWTEDDHTVQQGVALRIRTDADRTTAITVTKNIWAGVWFGFNVHVMDSAADSRYTKIYGLTLGEALSRVGQPAPGPWHLCARVQGDHLSFKVWPADEVEPPWMDGLHGGGVVLPAGWEQPGVPGWYAGHVASGGSITYVDRWTVPGPTTPATTGTTASTTIGAPAPAAPTGTVPFAEPTDIRQVP
jgi:hypothetical protein